MGSIKEATLILIGIIIGLTIFLLIGFNSSSKTEKTHLIEKKKQSSVTESDSSYRTFVKDNYKILIPGGTGFIGYHLCLFFVKKNWKVFSVSKSKPKKNRKIKGVKYIYCDVSNKKDLKKKL